MTIDMLLAMARERRRRAREDLVGGVRHLAERGHHRASADLYAALEELEPNRAEWPARLAVSHRRAGNEPAEIEALLRAAERYRQNGHPRWAIAMCRRVLRLVPDSDLARSILARVERDLPRDVGRTESLEPRSTRFRSANSG